MAMDYYSVLGVPRDADNETIKRAYHAALLRNHPDKFKQLGTTSSPATVMALKEAYEALTNSNSRVVVDESLQDLEEAIKMADIVDLSMLIESTDYWYRDCRCGQDKAFLVFVDDLEANIDIGEVAVQCSGCSLWIRVQYDVDDQSSDSSDDVDG